MATAPAFRFPPPDEALLRELVVGYEHVTGDPVHRPAKRNLIAASYRLHGDAFLPLVVREFRIRGTVTNLLGEIRCMTPEPRRTEIVETWPTAAPPETLPSAALRSDLPNADPDSAPFDPTSKRRYDRPPTHPDGGGFFSDDELGVRTASPTARALTR